MQILKKAICAILAFTMLLGISGCATESKEDVENKTLAYMGNKYHESFTITAFDIGVCDYSGSPGYCEMDACSNSFPNARIVIRRGRKSGEIVDNYSDFLMKDKIEKKITSIAQPIYGDCKVFYTAGGGDMSETNQGNMTVDDYAKTKSFGFSLTICIYDPKYQSNKDQKLEELRTTLADRKYDCDLYITYMRTKENLESVDDADMQELFASPKTKKWIDCSGEFLMDRDYKFFTDCKWEEIK